MKSSKCTEIILNILLVVVGFGVGIIMFWQLYPYQVLIEGENNYQLDKTTFLQGDDFNIKLVVCKNYDIEEEVLGKFIDGVIYSIPANASRLDKGCYDTYISSVKIPDNLPPGNYTYQETVIYEVNPLRSVVYTFTTPEFEVVGN